MNTPNPPTAGSDRLSEWLDCFRWLSAVFVLYTHTTNRFTVPLAETAQRDAVTYVSGFLSGFSHQAVMVFFVLSGYLVGGALLREADHGAVNVRSYLLKRFARLWIVIVPALVLSLAISVAVPGATTNLGSLSPSSFICNIAFLQTVACNQYADNGPLWSLFNEFWYYFFFLVIVRAMLSPSVAVRVVGVAGSLVAMLLLTLAQRDGSLILPYFVIWLLGAWAARVKALPFARVWPLVLALVVVLIGVRLGIRRDWWEQVPLLEYSTDIMLASVFSALVATMRLRPLIRAPLGRVNAFLAGFSFSIYCTHVPILNAFMATRQTSEGTQKLPITLQDGLWWVVWPMLVCLAVGYAFSLVSERHTLKLRKLLEAAYVTAKRATNVGRQPPNV